ncbi:MAG: FAD-dependent monooxygenase [Myxococcota bacterium]|nr:FAD-dependent monooxygenase [Myxococcota bacterium]
MKIACIGGGPAGLYLGILVKRVAPEHEVVVYERNRATDTFGFGVVFSDATLGHLAAADPETHAQITARFARWGDIEVHIGGEVLRSTGHGFCGIERKQLLQILQARAVELGVRVEFEHEVKSLAELAGADVIVACDGVASWVREALKSDLQPNVDVRPNKFVWLGCTVPYDAFTFLFKETPHGLFRVHAYRYHEQGSTFIVECTHETWRAAKLDEADEDATVRILEDVFAAELRGHHFVKNRSIWRNFPTVRCGKWHAGNVVLVGDAAHTAHFSIGSGTKLAMEDSIALRDELLANADVPAALAAYERRRRPEVEALQAAAQASLEWFEGTERYLKMSPVQFTYSLMTRSLRVSHASMVKRDPDLARGATAMLGGTGAPTQLSFTTPQHRVRSRFVAAPLAAWTSSADDLFVALGAAAAEGAGIVATPPLRSEMLESDDSAVAWRRIIDYVHGKGALIAARVIMPTERALERLAFAGFDLVVLDPDGDERAIELLPAAIADARAKLGDTWLGAVVDDRRTARVAVVGHAAQLVRAGASLLWVTARGDGNARLPAAPMADRLRNELDVATCVEADDASLSDLDAAVAAGRADLVVVTKMPPPP